MSALIPGLLIGGGTALLALPKFRTFVIGQIRTSMEMMRARVAGVSSRRLGSDLRLCGLSIEEIAVWKILAPLISVAGLGGVVLILSAFAINVSFGWLLPLLIVSTVLSFHLPDSMVRARAKRLRMTFLFSFSSFLDLTNVLLAGGAGMETALIAAGEAGEGIAFVKIREALTRARTTHRSPWRELQRMGDLLGIEVVSEVGASIQLAGEHGARVRGSLAKRAESVRQKQSAQIEAAANAATERMGLPMVLLFLGFLVLIGYPATVQMFQGL